MHEASLVTSLLRQVEQLAARNGGGRIGEIRVSVGPLAGVEPLLFDEAFQRLRLGSTAKTARLVLDAVPLTARCRDCGGEYRSQELEFACPACNGRNVDVIGGDAVILESFTIEEVSEASVAP
jgi:hydrogenase nickel incorporation protein HypA/HybF